MSIVRISVSLEKDLVAEFDRKIAGHGSPAEILADTALLQANNLIHRHFHHARDHRAMRTG